MCSGKRGLQPKPPLVFTGALLGFDFIKLEVFFKFAAPCSDWALGAGAAWKCSQVNGSGGFIPSRMLNGGT